MKEKRSKKESNKEEAKEEGRNVTVFASFSEAAAPQENLKIDWPSFIRFFNDTLRRHGSPIARIEFLSKGKKSRVQSIVNNYNTKQALVTAIEKMARSDFLNGRIQGARSNRAFIASFIWLTESDDHFEKVLNGYYDNPPTQELTSSGDTAAIIGCIFPPEFFCRSMTKPAASRKRFAKNSANGARKGHAEPSATKNTSE